MEKRNKLFLKNILFVLGHRKKHPWGESLGFKNARITSIFNGVPPTADALDVIARSENVNINWLLNGEGYPFYTHNWYSENKIVELFSSKGILQAILTDSLGRATLISFLRETFEYGDTEAKYRKYYVVPDVSLELLAESRAHIGDQLLIPVDSKTLDEINSGVLGPVHISSDIILREGSRISSDDFDDVLKSAGRFNVNAHDETALFNAFKRLDYRKRNAVLTIIDALSNTYDN